MLMTYRRQSDRIAAYIIHSVCCVSYVGNTSNFI